MNDAKPKIFSNELNHEFKSTAEGVQHITAGMMMKRFGPQRQKQKINKPTQTNNEEMIELSSYDKLDSQYQKTRKDYLKMK